MAFFGKFLTGHITVNGLVIPYDIGGVGNLHQFGKMGIQVTVWTGEDPTFFKLGTHGIGIVFLYLPTGQFGSSL